MKRGFDILISALGLLLFSPLLLLIILVSRLTLGRQVFFMQTRPGLQGRPFKIIKFRTMTDARCAKNQLLPDEHRLTAFGQFLRKSSLDELPELLNVLRGDMSMVGPRPLLMEYLPLYTPEQRRRHDVRPGLTGWAQIHGRNVTTWEERLARDVWYVDHRSFLLDLRILCLTLLQVFSLQGINASGHVTMPRFQGTAQRRKDNAG